MRPEEEHLNTAPPKKKAGAAKKPNPSRKKNAPFPAAIRQIF